MRRERTFLHLPQLNPHLLLALTLTVAFHFSLLFYTFKRTYDAYVHIFFADHYARAWFDHWEYRWYTGFTMTSYPPGSQQSIALLSPLLGLQNGFIVVQLVALLLVVVGIYRFARIWVSEEAAGYAALLTVFASSINETVHVFGQLPTTFSLGFLLNALPFAYQWLRHGRFRFLLLAWAANAATTAGHHVTTLFGAVFFMGPIFVLAIVEKLRRPLPDETAVSVPLTRATWRPLVVRRLRRIVPVTGRSALYGVGLIAILLLVVLPYWLWSTSDPIVQVPIPHASRDSFILNPNAGLVFWLIPYGVALPLLPYVFYKAFSTKAWPLGLSLGLLFVLGTGGTTPLPRLLLRGAYDILTLDRFTFWATILLLPFLGEFVVSLRHGRFARYLREQFGDGVWRGVQVGLVLAYLGTAVFTVNLTQFRRFQPEPIDMQPIVSFLQKDQHWRWRYLPLGFGDQLAWLSAQSTATTVDGNYHSARRLPELTSTPVERLEGAKFRGIPGIGSLQQFLAVPDKYNLKFVFSNDQFYDPLLYFSGWHRVQRLENGIVVWEREDIPPLPELLPRREIPASQRLLWGLVPMTAVFTALIAMTVALFLPLPPPVASRLPWPLQTIWQWLDRRLLGWSCLPELSAGPTVRWQRWLDWWQRHARWPQPAPPSARQVRAALLLLIVLATAVGGWLVMRQRATTPQQVLTAYYDDLDFRRFEAAYERLDPNTRPVFDQFLLELSVRGGLLASYAKLERLETAVLASGDGWQEIAVQTDWITALDRYQTTQVHELVRRGSRWTISPTPVDITIPPDQFFRRGEVVWQSQGRRRVTIETTEFGDVLDRPELQILSARLVQVNGRYAVVGELINTDADPADVTIAAYLYDAAGNELAWYNAQAVMIHKLLPKEVTPFRIDFEGVAGAALVQSAADLDFDPAAFTEASLGQSPVHFEVYARAVVTGRDLYRDVAAQQIQVVNGEIRGELLNNGTREATIPHLLLTYYDAQNRVAWVDHIYLEQAIRPQRALPFAVSIVPPSAVVTVLDRGDVYANILQQEIAPNAAWVERLQLPPETGYAAVRLSVHAFVAGEE